MSNDIARAKKERLLNSIIQMSKQDFIIERPNVAVRMVLYPHNAVIEGRGFAKVSYPDKWDADFGVALAAKKAAAQIVREAKAFNIDLGYLMV